MTVFCVFLNVRHEYTNLEYIYLSEELAENKVEELNKAADYYEVYDYYEHIIEDAE